MAGVTLLVALLVAAAALVGLAHGQPGCTSFPDPYAEYTTTLCPLTGATSTPITLTNQTFFTPTSYSTGVSPQIAIPFPVRIYGLPYDRVYISTSGVLQFGPTPLTSTSQNLPVYYYNDDVLPIVAAAWTQLYWEPTVGNITYSTQGAVGSRQFIVRYDRIQWSSFRTTNPNALVSFDIIFTENLPGKIEVRYFRFDTVPTTISMYTSIGLQSNDDGMTVLPIVNYNQSWTAVANQFVGQSLTFVYIGQDGTNPTTCGSLGYDLSSLMGRDLSYRDSANTMWYFRPCGVVSNVTCTAASNTEHSMVCQVPATGPTVNLGVYSSRSTSYQYFPNSTSSGLTAYSQTGQYCSTIVSDRFTIINYMCDAAATTAFISSAYAIGSSCVNSIQVNTALVCGRGNRDTSTVATPAASSLTSCISIPGFDYTGVACPRNSSWVGYQPIPLSNPVNALPLLTSQLYGGYSTAINIGFNFHFYGQSFSTVFIALNGALYFNQPYSGTMTSPPSFGFTGSYQDYLPVIGAFSTYLSTQTYPGIPVSAGISYSLEGTAPNRQFVVRYKQLQYYYFRAIYGMTASFDIILYEGENAKVDIRYYSIAANSNLGYYLTIGLHGDSDPNEYTSYVPYTQLTPLLASQLTGSTVSFAYTGNSRLSGCMAFGANFSSVTTRDLIFDDTANSGYNYYINPCDVLTTNPCASVSPSASICQSSSPTNSYPLSIYNPNGIVWTQSPSPLLGVRATIVDGAYCGAIGSERTVQIDWICNKVDLITHVVSVSEPSTCVYNIVINTPVACHTTVTCQSISAAFYNGSFCPYVAPRLTQTRPVTVLEVEDDANIRVKLPFIFHSYGVDFDYVWINSNGVLSFGTVPLVYAYTGLPLTGSDLDATPVIAGFYTDLLVANSGTITYSNETIDGQQVFVVRYTNIDYYGWTTVGAEARVSFDILMYEGLTGQVELRYYNVSSSDQTITVGMMSDDDFNYVLLASNTPVTVAVASSFTNSTAVFYYSGPDVLTSTCGALGYNLSTLASQDLVFNSTNYIYTLKICGVVGNSVCQSSSIGERSMLCQEGFNYTSDSWDGQIYSLATWNPNAALWRYQSGANGLQLIMQDGGWCGAVNAPRTTIVNFNCNATVTTPRFTSLVEATTCVYTANISTSLACAPGDRYNSTVTGPARSTLQSCVTTNGALYNAVLCPRATNDAYLYPQSMINATRILAVNDDAQQLNIPFPFYFYDLQVTSLFVSSNGLVEFGYTANSSPADAAFPGLGFSNTDNFPILAPFVSATISDTNWTDLINIKSHPLSSYAGYIQYSYEGAAPTRRLVIRFSSVDYYAYRNEFFDERGVSFDIVLTEGEPGGIEIRYYKIDANPFQTVLIGAHGFGNSYTAVQNAVVLTPMLVDQLSGATLTFTYTGAREADLCGGDLNGYNFSALSNADLNYTSGGFTYYFRPCGTVTAPVCTANYATSHVTLCQATSTGATMALAIDNPTATVYSYPNDLTVRATISDGQYCASISGPRVTVIDYICNAGATKPVFWSASETSTCNVNIKVNTSLACPTQPSNCTTYNGPYYTGRLCRQSNTQLAAAQTNPIPVLYDSSTRDDGTIQVALPFEVHVGGQIWQHVWISVNGFLQFGATTSPSIYSSALPFGASYEDSLPIVSAYQCDLYNANRVGTSNITYSSEGVAPNRFFVVRWSGLNHYNTNPISFTSAVDTLVSFDVRVYEGSSNLIEVIYNNMTTSASYLPTIGIMLNDGTSYTAVNNGQTLFASGLSLTGYALRWMYNGSDVSTASCGGLGYNFTSLMGTDLSYSFQYSSTQTMTVYYNPCGVVRNASCASQIGTERATACAVTRTTSTGALAYKDLGIYAPSFAAYAYINNGVQQYLQTGPYCSTSGLAEILYTDFVCDPTATTPRITDVALTVSSCVNYIVVNTSLACGGGNRNSQNNTNTKPLSSSLTTCITYTGSAYNAVQCPRNDTDVYYYPKTMTNPVPILIGVDTGVQQIPIGFNFNFYGMDNFTRVNVSANGVIQFGMGFYTAAPTSTLTGYSSTDSNNDWPFIAPLWTDLINAGGDTDVTYPGSITYSTEGQAPNRQLIVRFNLVDYANYRYYPSVTGVSFDVVLSESAQGTPGALEVRYYRVDSNPTKYMVVGLRGDDYAVSTYTAVANYMLITAQLANQLQGSTVKYVYTGQNAAAACGAFGYSLTSLGGRDLSWTDIVNSKIYYLRVCGIVQASICADYAGTQHSSLCETSSAGQPIASATIFNPSGVTWTQFNGGIASINQDGTYCSTISAPRKTTINYLCVPTATTPVLLNVTVPTTCNYVAFVQTAAACVPVPASSSSSTGASSSAVSSSATPSSSSSSAAVPSSAVSSSARASSSSSSSGAAASSSSSSNAASSSSSSNAAASSASSTARPSSSSSSSAATPSSSSSSSGTQTRPSSSSSSTAGSVPSSSSSSAAALTPSFTSIVFTIPQVTLPNGVGANNLAPFKANFVTDVAINMVAASSMSASAGDLTPYITVQSVGAFPGSRRLLQTQSPITLVINGDISNVAGQPVTQLSDALAQRIQNGQFTAVSGAIVPAQSVTYFPLYPASWSSSSGVNSEGDSSSSLSGGTIAGIVIGTVVGAVLLCVLAFILCIVGRRGTKGAEKMDSTNSEASQVDHGVEHSQHPLSTDDSGVEGPHDADRQTEEPEIEMQEV